MLQNNQISAEQIPGLLPQLSIDNRQALDCWRFLGAMDFEAALLWAELYDVDDVDGLLERLIVIRDGCAS